MASKTKLDKMQNICAFKEIPMLASWRVVTWVNAITPFYFTSTVSNMRNDGQYSNTGNNSIFWGGIKCVKCHW